MSLRHISLPPHNPLISPMVPEYEPLIDSLVRTKNLEELENIELESLLQQLKSFLNTDFDEHQTDGLEKIFKSRIEHYRRQRKLDKSLRLKLTQRKHEKFLLSFVYGKIYRAVWLNMLYESNLKTNAGNDVLELSNSQYDSDISSSEDDLHSDERREFNNTPENLVYKLTRDNLTMFECMEFPSNLERFKLPREVFQEYRGREVAQKSVRRRGTSFEKSVLSFSDMSPQKMFTWTPAVQDLLKVTQPLTLFEVIDLVCNYVNDRNLWKDGKLQKDGKVDFLAQGTTSSRTLRVYLLAVVNQQRVKLVGLANGKGDRLLLDEEKEPNAKPECDIEDLKRRVPCDLYNVSEKLLRKRVEKLVAQTDIKGLFRSYYPKESKNERRLAGL